MKKLLSLVLIVAISLSICTVASAGNVLEPIEKTGIEKMSEEVQTFIETADDEDVSTTYGNFEIVQFVPTVTGNYTIKVTRSSGSSSLENIGLAVY